MEQLIGWWKNNREIEKQPLDYPKTPYENVAECRSKYIEPYSERRWNSISSDGAILALQILNNHTNERGKMNLSGARRVIDQLIAREVADLGEEQVPKIIKFYENLAYGDLAEHTGAMILGQEMYWGYERWMAKHAPTRTERLQNKYYATLQKVTKWGKV